MSKTTEVAVQPLPELTGEYVLVRQTVTNKKSAIILDANSKDLNQEITYEIVKLGPLVPENYGLKVGKFPIFSNHFSNLSSSIETWNDKTNEGTMLVIAHYLDIIGMK